jgi:FKBP-type peptidyl-prolyl cis-trans isomerase FklB
MFSTQQGKMSYIIGMDIGQSLRQQGIKIEVESLAAGILDALKGEKPRLSTEDAQATIEAFQSEMKAQSECGGSCSGGSCSGGSCSGGSCGGGSCGDSHETSTEDNLTRGLAFLQTNSKKEGVVTLASGLQYKEIKAGTGRSPSLKDQVTTHYHGTLTNGTVFDSSYNRNEPATFPVNGVISGWTEALQLMKEGSIWELFIPSELAYGHRGAGSDIGPDEALVFKVELIRVH